MSTATAPKIWVVKKYEYKILFYKTAKLSKSKNCQIFYINVYTMISMTAKLKVLGHIEK